jgi:hypothetical protein
MFSIQRPNHIPRKSPYFVNTILHAHAPNMPHERVSPIMMGQQVRRYMPITSQRTMGFEIEARPGTVAETMASPRPLRQSIMVLIRPGDKISAR